MGQEFLVKEQMEAGEQLACDFNEYACVDVAFWIKPVESNAWYLHIASSEINDTNVDVAYGEILRLAAKNKYQWLDVFRVKLLASSDPLAAEVIKIRDNYPIKIPTPYHGSSIASTAIDGAYIYPPLTAQSSAS